MSAQLKDPYPNLGFAKKHLWNMLDHWAWRRMQRLGFPSPWAAWTQGYNEALAQNGLRTPELTHEEIRERMSR